jgi:hypothetical protein
MDKRTSLAILAVLAVMAVVMAETSASVDVFGNVDKQTPVTLLEVISPAVLNCMSNPKMSFYLIDGVAQCVERTAQGETNRWTATIISPDGHYESSESGTNSLNRYHIS